MKKKRRKNSGSFVFLAATAVVVALAVFLTVTIYDHVREKKKATGTVASVPTGSTVSEKTDDPDLVAKLSTVTVPDYVTVNLLDVGKARSGEKLINVTNIVIHYVGNAGTTAAQNRNYFGQNDTEVCSHFIVGLDGEIVQCVPLDEQSAASNERNINTISIETCHPDDSGKFGTKTYNALVKLTAWLCEVTGLDSSDVIRHYDITGKECPLYFVENTEEWETFKADVASAMG